MSTISCACRPLADPSPGTLTLSAEKDALPRSTRPVNRHSALPHSTAAQEIPPASLSLRHPHRRSEPAHSSLILIVRKTFSSSVFALTDELSLLPPRSARLAPPPCFTARLLQHQSAPLPQETHRPSRKHRQFSEQLNSIGTLQHVSYRMPTSMATALSSSFTYTLHVFATMFGALSSR